MIEDKELKQMNELGEFEEEVSNLKKEKQNNNENLDANRVRNEIIKYGGTSINIVQDRSGNWYFHPINTRVNSKLLKISKSVDPRKAAKTLAKAVNIAENSSWGLNIDYYETDDGKTLQVDYELSPIDLDLISDTKKLVGVDCYKLVDWLNAEYQLGEYKSISTENSHSVFSEFGDFLVDGIGRTYNK